MKLKLLYGLGAITTIAPLVAVVSCGCTSKQKTNTDEGTNPNPPIVDPEGPTTNPDDGTPEPPTVPEGGTIDPDEGTTDPVPPTVPEGGTTNPEEPEERPTPPTEKPDTKLPIVDGLRKWATKGGNFSFEDYNLDQLKESKYIEEGEKNDGYSIAAIIVDYDRQFQSMNNIERLRRFLIRNAGKKVAYVILQESYGKLFANTQDKTLNQQNLEESIGWVDHLREITSEKFWIDYEKAKAGSQRYPTTFTAFTKDNKLIFDQRLDHNPNALSLYWPGNPLDLIKYERYDFQVEIIKNFLEKHKGQKVSIGLINIDEGIEQYHALHDFTVPNVMPNTITEFVKYVNSYLGDNGTYANAEDFYKSFDEAK